MIRKLQIKFICMTMVMVTIVLTAMLGMQYRSTADSLERESLELLQAAAGRPMGMSRPGDFSQPCFALAQTQWGQLLISGNSYYDLTDQDLVTQIYDQACAAGETSGVLEDFSLRFLRRDLTGGAVYVFTDITSELQMLKNLRRNCLLIGAVSFFAFLAVSILLSRWIIRPVEQAWKQQRQFVADASHELKTPLTVILTNAELLQESGGEHQFTGNILAMSHQMRGLVESLLQLARADNGQTRAEIAKLDYSALVEDALLPFEPLYFEQGLTLESVIEPGITLMGSEIHLRQVVEILLDNGQKYSAPGTVRLELRRQGRNQCILRLSTPGKELTAQECRDIFKRFYRTDQVRSMNHSYGLGLAIAQRIVEDHKGKIWAESGDGQNIFCVTLPLM